MNPKDLEQLLLLEQSGELTPQQQRRLEAELAAAPAARQLRRELQGMARAIPEPPAGPAPDATEKILARLAANRPAPAHNWFPTVAAAAALALLLGSYALHSSRSLDAGTGRAQATQSAMLDADEWTDPLEQEFADLENLFRVMAEQPLFDLVDL